MCVEFVFASLASNLGQWPIRRIKYTVANGTLFHTLEHFVNVLFPHLQCFNQRAILKEGGNCLQARGKDKRKKKERKTKKSTNGSRAATNLLVHFAEICFEQQRKKKEEERIKNKEE